MQNPLNRSLDRLFNRLPLIGSQRFSIQIEAQRADGSRRGKRRRGQLAREMAFVRTFTQQQPECCLES